MTTLEEACAALSITQWSTNQLAELAALYTIAKNTKIKIFPFGLSYILNTDVERKAYYLVKEKYVHLSPIEAESEYINLAKIMLEPFSQRLSNINNFTKSNC